MSRTETDQPTESLESLNEALSDLIEDIYQHLKYEHNGYPATSCHRCMNYQQKLLNLKDDIAEASRNTEEIKKDPA